MQTAEAGKCLQVKEGDIAKDVIEDFQRGYEYAEAQQLLKMKKRGDAILYLVRCALQSIPYF